VVWVGRQAVVILLVSARFPWSRLPQPSLSGLGQVDQVSGSQVGTGQGGQVSVSLIPVQEHIHILFNTNTCVDLIFTTPFIIYSNIFIVTFI